MINPQKIESSTTDATGEANPFEINQDVDDEEAKCEVGAEESKTQNNEATQSVAEIFKGRLRDSK